MEKKWKCHWEYNDSFITNTYHFTLIGAFIFAIRNLWNCYKENYINMPNVKITILRNI